MHGLEYDPIPGKGNIPAFPPQVRYIEELLKASGDSLREVTMSLFREEYGSAKDLCSLRAQLVIDELRNRVILGLRPPTQNIDLT